MGKLDIAWIRGSNALSIFRTRICPHIKENTKKLTKSSCSVFVPLCHDQGRLSVLFTRRTDTLKSHTGQISFPGGRCDNGETAIETSVREMEEEIGIQPQETWGTFSRPITSLAMEDVYFAIGYIGELDKLKFTLSENEVSHVFTVSLEELVHSRQEQTYFNQRSQQQWEMLADRMIAEGIPSEDERLNAVKHISTMSEYKMPMFPSPLPQDPDIWGLTAIMTDRVLHFAFRKDGYRRFNLMHTKV